MKRLLDPKGVATHKLRSTVTDRIRKVQKRFYKLGS